MVACAGFSLGEFSALVYSGAISFEDGVRLVNGRAEAMQKCVEQHQGAMASVAGLEDPALVLLCEEAGNVTGKKVQIANYLFPKGRTVSGDVEAVDWMCSNAKERGATNAKRIKTSGAFHTQAMLGAQAAVSKLVDDINITLPEHIKVYSNVTGKPYSSVNEMRTLLKRQVCEPVFWEDTIKAIIAELGPNKFIETGPGQQLKAMMKRTDMEAFEKCIVLK